MIETVDNINVKNGNKIALPRSPDSNKSLPLNCPKSTVLNPKIKIESIRLRTKTATKKVIATDLVPLSYLKKKIAKSNKKNWPTSAVYRPQSII